MKPLTTDLREALRTWGEEPGYIHLGEARALARRGLVRDAQPGIDCRLASCWPLTEEGVKHQHAIRQGWL